MAPCGVALQSVETLQGFRWIRAHLPPPSNRYESRQWPKTWLYRPLLCSVRQVSSRASASSSDDVDELAQDPAG